jgi:hypothetical protein
VRRAAVPYAPDVVGSSAAAAARSGLRSMGAPSMDRRPRAGRPRMWFVYREPGPRVAFGHGRRVRGRSVTPLAAKRSPRKEPKPRSTESPR